MVAGLRFLTRELERPGQHGRHGGGPAARARSHVLPGSVVRSRGARGQDLERWEPDREAGPGGGAGLRRPRPRGTPPALLRPLGDRPLIGQVTSPLGASLSSSVKWGNNTPHRFAVSME